MDGTTAVLRIDHGPVNAMDIDFLRDIVTALEEASRRSARAVVVTGKEQVFSAGADLKRVLREDASYVRERVSELGKAFLALFRFPVPVVAAVNGHAIAGGCVVASACDYRVLSRPATIGLAELRVGVPYPTAALEIMRFATGGTRLQELVYLAENYGSDDALARHLVDEVVEPDRLMSRAFEIAGRLAAIPAASFRQTKEALRRPVVELIEREAPVRDVEVAELWASADVRASIRRFLDALAGRPSP
jgi:enoyl-CoA hydratase